MEAKREVDDGSTGVSGASKRNIGDPLARVEFQRSGGGGEARATLKRVLQMENSGVVSSRASRDISVVEEEGTRKVLGDQWVVEMAIEPIDIAHHASAAMEDLIMVAQEFLSPAANLMDGTFIFKNFLHGGAVAEPKELSAPKKFLVLTDAPATGTGLANEGMEMPFALSAAARTEPDGA